MEQTQREFVSISSVVETGSLGDRPRGGSQACIATEISNVLSEQMLKQLGESELFPIAVRFYQELEKQNIIKIAKNTTYNLDVPANQDQYIKMIARWLVNECPLIVKTAVEMYYCEGDGTFFEFDEKIERELRKKRDAENKIKEDLGLQKDIDSI